MEEKRDFEAEENLGKKSQSVKNQAVKSQERLMASHDSQAHRINSRLKHLQSNQGRGFDREEHLLRRKFQEKKKRTREKQL